ncbi:hypothetical protein [Endozoicomonas lisbonensis]|uniref:Uncharacterized protein n=1 Tax=Endozoicomonas lisbonensis TaxID=3120522 RepID=A0ABV2SPD0_9GAMM
MGVELLLLPVIVAFIDWGMPLPADAIQDRIDTCISLNLEAEPQWTNDYWPGIEKLNFKNYVRNVRCTELPAFEQLPDVEIEVSPLKLES